MTRKPAQVLVIAAMLASPAGSDGQIVSKPTPPLTIVADNEDWYRSGEPIAYAGALYFPAGAILHFDGNRMVPTGGRGGVPFYADVFLDPYSKIFVPLSGGLLQPYERRRDGELAGTTGSQAPSFPVAIAAEAPPFGQRAGWPGAGALAIGPAAREPVPMASDERTAPPDAPAAVGTAGVAAAAGRGVSRDTRAFAALQRPTGLNAIFLTYEGARWRPAGPAVEFNETLFRAAGDYHGFPVFVDDPSSPRAGARVIYLPARPGMVTPYVPVSRR